MNPYNPETQPTLHAAIELPRDRYDNINDGIDDLLYSIQEIDLLVDRLQRGFVAKVCDQYEGHYVASMGWILFTLTNSILRAAIRIEQVPDDLRETVQKMALEAGKHDR